MQVGDLVKVMTEHYLPGSRLWEATGQLAIVIERNAAACNPWKVNVINDRELWLKSYELEKL